ncbi:uncharacterized protein ACNLHF_014440 [Anomaloglossus baeobatrachus]|uniref:uncharacterized protein LOC142302135 n=1 Tax=Anomaloglossus baeobatrachus TaxID=238106 RepID=UPI003F50A2FD
MTTTFIQPLPIHIKNAIIQHANVAQSSGNSSLVSTTEGTTQNIIGGQFHDEVVNGYDVNKTSTTPKKDVQFPDEVVNGYDVNKTSTTPKKDVQFPDEVVSGYDVNKTSTTPKNVVITTSNSIEGLKDAAPNSTNATQEERIIEQRNLEILKEIFLEEFLYDNDIDPLSDSENTIIDSLKDKINSISVENAKERFSEVLNGINKLKPVSDSVNNIIDKAKGSIKQYLGNLLNKW